MINRLGVKLVFAAALVLFGVYTLFPAYVERRETARDLSELNRELLSEEKAQEDLRDEIYRLRTDSRAVEHVARDKFGLCRKDEKIYDFSPAAARRP